ncbi:hypothetical protein TBR22_A30390 [Luteitalea sp. TBR-22]|uniref:hypothetical protein n=1 Tax=Luteitalea sp. TBR-22 TaxID=2802971 RepID=UPI001AF34DCC|nr:hypothetical protein [Luteitalea sp. TBR-22]BCS33811.1 hypothetical protein TBR22_A30390 [Luteitalea sp. TBR-22]
MALLDRLRAELETGGARMAGAHVRVRLPLRQGLIDGLLAHLPGVPAGLAVALGPQLQVQVRYGGLHANARIRPSATLRPRPELTVELASQLVAWGLRTVALPPFVRLDGRLVRVALDQGPLHALAPLWRHVRSLTFIPTTDGLEVDLEARVDPEAPR